MLTQKQEKYVQELIKGKTQREAYKAAYDAENMLDRTIDQKASLLLKQAKVRARYDELMSNAVAKTADDAESMRAFIIETLKKIASGEICEETKEYDGEGNLLRQKRSVKPSDVKDAMLKLAEYYGVAAEKQDNVLTVVFQENDYAD